MDPELGLIVHLSCCLEALEIEREDEGFRQELVILREQFALLISGSPELVLSAQVPAPCKMIEFLPIHDLIVSRFYLTAPYIEENMPVIISLTLAKPIKLKSIDDALILRPIDPILQPNTLSLHDLVLAL